jgi:hypothetical protein
VHVTSSKSSAEREPGRESEREGESERARLRCMEIAIVRELLIIFCRKELGVAGPTHGKFGKREMWPGMRV